MYGVNHSTGTTVANFLEYDVATGRMGLGDGQATGGITMNNSVTIATPGSGTNSLNISTTGLTSTIVQSVASGGTINIGSSAIPNAADTLQITDNGADGWVAVGGRGGQGQLFLVGQGASGSQVGLVSVTPPQPTNKLQIGATNTNPAYRAIEVAATSVAMNVPLNVNSAGMTLGFSTTATVGTVTSTGTLNLGTANSTTNIAIADNLVTINKNISGVVAAPNYGAINIQSTNAQANLVLGPAAGPANECFIRSSTSFGALSLGPSSTNTQSMVISDSLNTGGTYSLGSPTITMNAPLNVYGRGSAAPIFMAGGDVGNVGQINMGTNTGTETLRLGANAGSYRNIELTGNLTTFNTDIIGPASNAGYINVRSANSGCSLQIAAASGPANYCGITPLIATGGRLYLGSSNANTDAVVISDSGFSARSFNILTAYTTFTADSDSNAGPSPPAPGNFVSALTGNRIDVNYICNYTLAANPSTGGTDLITNVVFHSNLDNSPKLPIGVPMCISNYNGGGANNQTYRLWYQKNSTGNYYYFGNLQLAPTQTAYIRIITYYPAGDIGYSLKIETYGSTFLNIMIG
jgi:hypothetical protein